MWARMVLRSAVSVGILGTALATPSNAQVKLYVNGTCGNDAWTGSSPICQPSDGPKATIQAGINAAADGDTVTVADGVYTGEGNRNLDFGGREIVLRSANGPESCIIDCEGVRGTRGFIFRSGETRRAVVRGFTIQNGNALDLGGGIYCSSSSPTIRNCRILNNNTWGRFGGGIYGSHSSPMIRDCTIAENTATGGAGLYFSSGSPTIRNCTIRGNRVRSGSAGGLGFFRSDVVITNCTIVNNVAVADGGGIRFSESNMTIINSTIAFNTAGGQGGGLFCRGESNAMLNNCILWQDNAAQGPEIALSRPSMLAVTYSNVQGGQAAVHVGDGSTLEWGPGNIDADPLFLDPASRDYHIAAGSPCIDAGDPAFVPTSGQTDLDGQRRIWNGRVDIGADEFGSFVFGDLNCDGAFDAADIDAFFISLAFPWHYSRLYPDCDRMLADTNADGVVNGADIDTFFERLVGRECP